MEIDRRIRTALSNINGPRYQDAADSLLFLLLEFDIDDRSPQGAEIHGILGARFLRAKLYRYALTHLLKAHESGVDLPDFQKGYLTNSIAGAYTKLRVWDKALYYYRLGLQGQLQESNVEGVSAALNNLGILFMEMGEIDSAEWYFLQAQERILNYDQGDPYYPGSIRDNLARVYKLQGRYREAREMYEENVALYPEAGRAHYRMQALTGLAEVRLKLGETESSLQTLNQAYPLLEKGNPKFKEELESEWLQVRILHAQTTRDFAALDQFSERFLAFKDSLLQDLHAEMESSIEVEESLIERDFQKEKKIRMIQGALDEAKVRQLRERARRFWMVGLAVATCLVLGASLIIRLQRQRAQALLKKQAEINEAQSRLAQEKLGQEKLAKEILELKVSLKQQDLTNFALDNQRKRKLIQGVGKHIQQLKPGEITKTNVNSILNEILLQTQTESIKSHYEENIDVVNAEFKANLLKRFPSLTTLELELCGMVRIGMQVKEIAAFRNVTENAILVARKRLRKKLGLETGTDLRAFLSEA